MSGQGGSPNGTSRALPFDRWFRYPAGFSTQTLTTALAAAGVAPGQLLVDCFAGAATTGTAAVARGVRFHGLEAHPLIAELGALKLRVPEVNPAELRDAAATTWAMAERRADESMARVATDADGQAVAQELGEHELVGRCYAPATLCELVGLRDAIEARVGPTASYLRWAMLGLLREVAAVRTGWPHQRPKLARRDSIPAVGSRFLIRVQAIAEDLAGRGDGWAGGTVVNADARISEGWSLVEPGAAAGCVSSPPYLNNYDYADATRLEMYFLKQADSWASLCATARDAMVVATTQQTTDRVRDQARQRLLAFPRIAATADRLGSQLSEERRKRPRGKEYDRVIICYLADLAEVFRQLHERLAVGARVAWVVGDSAPYGVYLDTPGLLTALAREVGLEAVSDTPLRVRGLRWRTNGTRHRVSLSERLIVLRRPQ